MEYLIISLVAVVVVVSVNAFMLSSHKKDLRTVLDNDQEMINTANRLLEAARYHEERVEAILVECQDLLANKEDEWKAAVAHVADAARMRKNLYANWKNGKTLSDGTEV